MRKKTSRIGRILTAALALTLSLGGVPSAALATEADPDYVTFFKTRDDILKAIPDADLPEVPLIAQDVTWTRLAGGDRYGTMEQISTQSFASSDFAVVASGENFPDALAASGLAGALNCPVLLATQEGLPELTKLELDRLGVKRVYIVGGAMSVGTAVEASLSSSGREVVRIEGASREETSLMVMAELRGLQQGNGSIKRSDQVIVCTGYSFADALSMAPWAYSSASQVLLTGTDGALTQAQVNVVLNDAAIARVLLIGGENSVSEAVRGQLAGRSFAWERLAGKDRYETSAEIARWVTGHGYGWNGVAVASGKSFPDALTGAPLAARNNAPLLLAEDLGQPTVKLLQQNRSLLSAGYLLGGPATQPLDDPLAVPPIDLSDEMCLMAQNQTSATDWLIMIDTSACQAGFFRRVSGGWARQHLIQISCGQDITPTIKGNFTVGEKTEGFGHYGDYFVYYATNIYGAYYMHSILYHWGTYDVKDGRLGYHISQGCVRMPIEWAKWVQDNIDEGSTIHIY